MKKEKEKEFYDEIKNWDFSKFAIETELLTNWDLYEILKKIANEDSKILDLGTGGGEKLLKSFPKVKEILGTDFSEAMIETANKNLLESGRDNISFRIMDNLNMDVPDNYYDIVVARNTITNPKQIYKCLKKNGYFVSYKSLTSKEEAKIAKNSIKNFNEPIFIPYNLPLSENYYRELVIFKKN